MSQTIRRDVEWPAIEHLLNHSLLNRTDWSEWIRPHEGFFDIRGLLERAKFASSTEQRLLHVAISLFNNTPTDSSVGDLLFLEQEDFETVVESLRILRRILGREAI